MASPAVLVALLLPLATPGHRARRGESHAEALLEASAGESFPSSRLGVAPLLAASAASGFAPPPAPAGVARGPLAAIPGKGEFSKGAGWFYDGPKSNAGSNAGGGQGWQPWVGQGSKSLDDSADFAAGAPEAPMPAAGEPAKTLKMEFDPAGGKDREGGWFYQGPAGRGSHRGGFEAPGSSFPASSAPATGAPAGSSPPSSFPASTAPSNGFPGSISQPSIFPASSIPGSLPASGFPASGLPAPAAEQVHEQAAQFMEFQSPSGAVDFPNAAPAGELALASPEVAEAEQLEEIAARVVDAAAPEVGTVQLPARWVQLFVPQSVVMRANPYPRSLGLDFTGTAELKSKPGFRVGFERWPTRNTKRQRHMHMSELMGESGFVAKVLDTQVVGDKTYMLTEALGSRTLEQKIPKWKCIWEPVMPLKDALPMMVNMLKGLMAMERAGMVHVDLSEGNLGVMPHGHQTFIRDLSGACLTDARHYFDSCVSVSGDVMGSAFRMAPEVEDAMPDRAAHNVWQLGLVFARMLFGGNLPTKEMGARGFDNGDDTSYTGRQMIQEAIRESFDIQQSNGYFAIWHSHRDVLPIIAGMLEKDPSRRWTAEQALEAAVHAMAHRGYPMPTIRQPIVIPEGAGEA